MPLDWSGWTRLCLFKNLSVLAFALPSRFSRAQLCATPWTVPHQAALSLGFSRQERWSGMLCPPPGALPDPRTEPASLTSPASAGRSLPLVPLGKPPHLGTSSSLFPPAPCPTRVHRGPAPPGPSGSRADGGPAF